MVNPKIGHRQVINSPVPQPQQGRMLSSKHSRKREMLCSVFMSEFLSFFLTIKSITNHLHFLSFCLLCVGSGYHL